MKPKSWWIQKILNHTVLPKRECPRCGKHGIQAFYGQGEPFEYKCLNCFTTWKTLDDLRKEKSAA